MANIERTPSTPRTIPNPTANANERATAESQKTTPCGAARRAAERVRMVHGHAWPREIDIAFRPLIEAARKVNINAEIISDPRTQGDTDCFAVSLDDIEALYRALRTIEED